MLVDADDVRGLLPEEDLDDTQIQAAMRLVAGWLRAASGRTDVSELADVDPLYSPALELVVLVVTNAEGLERKMIGPITKQWQRAAPNLLERRDAILQQVRRLRTMPSGNFPCAQPWPDPAYGRTYWWNNGIDAVGRYL